MAEDTKLIREINPIERAQEEIKKLNARELYVVGGCPIVQIAEQMGKKVSEIELWKREGEWAMERRNFIQEVHIGYRDKVMLGMGASVEKFRNDFKKMYDRATYAMDRLETGNADELEKYLRILEKLYLIGDKLHGFEAIRAANSTIMGSDLKPEVGTSGGSSMQVTILNSCVERAREAAKLVKQYE